MGLSLKRRFSEQLIKINVVATKSGISEVWRTSLKRVHDAILITFLDWDGFINYNA